MHSLWVKLEAIVTYLLIVTSYIIIIIIIYPRYKGSRGVWRKIIIIIIIIIIISYTSTTYEYVCACKFVQRIIVLL